MNTNEKNGKNYLGVLFFVAIMVGVAIYAAFDFDRSIAAPPHLGTHAEHQFRVLAADLSAVSAEDFSGAESHVSPDAEIPARYYQAVSDLQGGGATLNVDAALEDGRLTFRELEPVLAGVVKSQLEWLDTHKKSGRCQTLKELAECKKFEAKIQESGYATLLRTLSAARHAARVGAVETNVKRRLLLTHIEEKEDALNCHNDPTNADLLECMLLQAAKANLAIHSYSPQVQ